MFINYLIRLHTNIKFVYIVYLKNSKQFIFNNNKITLFLRSVLKYKILVLTLDLPIIIVDGNTWNA